MNILGESIAPVTTAKGLALQAKTNLGTHGVKFTRLGVGTGNRDIDYNNRNEIEKIISMLDERQSVEIGSIKIINKTAVMIRGILTNQNLTAGYEISEIGLYALDPDEGEILYSIVLFTKKDYFPSFDGFSTSSITLTYYTAVGNTANLNIAIVPDAAASALDIQDILNDFHNLQSEFDELKANGSGSSFIHISQSEPPNWKAGEWWYQVMESREVGELIHETLNTIPYDPSKPYHIEIDNNLETITNTEAGDLMIVELQN